MKCALTKILPFVLTMLVGLALGNSQRWFGFRHIAGSGQGTRTPHSRTWLVIHLQPEASFPEEAGGEGGRPCSVRLSVRFDASGQVTKTISEDSGEAEDCVAAATAAARQIVFTPASENGEPVSVLATVSYGFSEMRVRAAGRDGIPYCVTTRHPVVSPVEIVSVEGATEAEGWRVIYE